MASTTPVRARPLSPHLQVYRWGPHMTASILHRASGVAMGTVGAAVLVWFLAALAGGAESYATFHWFFFDLAKGAIGYVVGIGLTLAFFLHMANGIRHLVMDTGANFELKGNRGSATAVLVAAPVLTILYWLFLEFVK